jgi:hypothetical protein
VAISTATTPARPATSERITALASRVRRLSPDRRHPERFHEEKSEVVAELRRIARALAS